MRNGITNSMKHLNGKNGIILIHSSIYGDQTIYTKINLIDDKNKVGIHIGRQDIYLEMGEIVEVKILEKSALIVGDIMQIKINVE